MFAGEPIIDRSDNERSMPVGLVVPPDGGRVQRGNGMIRENTAPQGSLNSRKISQNGSVQKVVQVLFEGLSVEQRRNVIEKISRDLGGCVSGYGFAPAHPECGKAQLAPCVTRETPDTQGHFFSVEEGRSLHGSSSVIQAKGILTEDRRVTGTGGNYCL